MSQQINDFFIEDVKNLIPEPIEINFSNSEVPKNYFTKVKDEIFYETKKIRSEIELNNNILLPGVRFRDDSFLKTEAIVLIVLGIRTSARLVNNEIEFKETAIKYVKHAYSEYWSTLCKTPATP